VKAIRVPRQKRGQFNGLTQTEARDMVKTAQGWYPQGTAVLFGLYMGLRREEMAQVRWDRFTQGLAWYKVHGKGNRIDDLPVHPILQAELRPHAYLWAFPGRNGGHVTPATVWNWVREVADAAGIRQIHPHQLRHTAIATINDNTGDLRSAQTFARHARPETTAIYTRTTAARLEAAAASLDYLD
jgi:integrase